MRRLVTPLLWLAGAAFIIWSGTKDSMAHQTGGFFLPFTYPWLSVGKLLAWLTGEVLFFHLTVRPTVPKKGVGHLVTAGVVFFILALYHVYEAVNAPPQMAAHATWVVALCAMIILTGLLSPVVGRFVTIPKRRG